MKKHNLGHYILTVLYQTIKNTLSGIVFMLIIVIGYVINLNVTSPYNLIIAIPLMLIGGGLLINSLYSILLSIFYPSFNKGECVICS